MTAVIWRRIGLVHEIPDAAQVAKCGRSAPDGVTPKPVSDKQIRVYGLPRCPQCYPYVGSRSQP